MFTGALAAGAFLRLLTILGYPGALWFWGDSFVYLGASLRPQPNLSKATGYSFFLRALLPFHSLTLVAIVQHLMGLSVAVMIYVLLRRNGVSKTWSAVATLPQLLDGYIIEDEHMIMTETLFTFLLMIAMLMLLWKPRPVWWKMLVAGLITGCAALVRTDGEVMYAVFPLFLLLRGWSWKTVRGWLMAITFAVASLVPYAAYAGWFSRLLPAAGQQVRDYAGRGVLPLGPGLVVRQLRGDQADPRGGEDLPDRRDRGPDPAGQFVLGKPLHPQQQAEPRATPRSVRPMTSCSPRFLKKKHEYIRSSKLNPGFSPVTPASDKLLAGFAERAIKTQPLPYVKTVVKDVGLSFGSRGSPTPGRADLLLQLPPPLRGRAHRHQQGLQHAAARRTSP